MKIAKVQIPRIVKSIAITAPLLLTTPALKAQENNTQDCFIKSNTTCITETPDSMLESKPIKVGDSEIYPAVIVDLSKKTLYHYDLECYLFDAYKLSNNKNINKLKPGLLKITNIDKDPTLAAPKSVTCVNIDRETGNIIGKEEQIKLDTSDLKKGAFLNNIKLEKDDAVSLFNNLYKEQYILIRK